MRVVILGGFAPSLTTFRGPLLAAMVARGHEVTAMAPGDDPEVRDLGRIVAQLDGLGVAFEPVRLQRTGIDPRADVRTLATLVRRFRALRPDLVLTYTIKPIVYGSLAAWAARVPRRVALITGFGYALAPSGTPRQRAIAGVARGLYRAGLSRCDTIFFQNADDRAQLAALIPPYARVEVVRGSGVDVDHYACSPLPDGPPRFLFVGRLLRDKGIVEYVEAARRVRAHHPAARFGVVGWIDPNPESVSRADLDGWIASGAIEYHGATDDVRPYLRDAHALVLPSYREGTPRSVLEAMSMGRAVITTDAPGCRDTIVDGESGILVPVRSSQAVAAAALRLIETPDLLPRLAFAGRVRAETLYDARRVAAQMLEILGL